MSLGSAKSSGSVSESMRSESSSGSSGFWWDGSSSSSGSSGSSDLSSGSGGVGGSSSSSGGLNDSGSIGSSSSSSSSGSSGSSSGFCDWIIRNVTYQTASDMTFILENTGTVPIEFTSIWVYVDEGMVDTGVFPEIAPRFPGVSFFLAPGESQAFGISSTLDLRLTFFGVDGSCGTKDGEFPAS